MLNTLNKKKSPHLPAEFSAHKATIAMFPFRNDIWRENAIHAQKLIIDIINIISKKEKVYLCCSKKIKTISNYNFNSNVSIINVEYDDIWARDISPFFINCNDKLAGVIFCFNAWGGIDEGSYSPWDNDAAFSSKFCDILGIKKYCVDLILEGGAIITNGQGVLITTESVLLNKNRNPNVSKRDFEKIFELYFGIKKVIWLKRGFIEDETDGHVDVFVNFIDDCNLFLAWTDDKKNIQYDIVREAYDILIRETTMSGKPFIIHKLLMPEPIIITKEEAAGIVPRPNSLPRTENMILYPTYNNAYIYNGGVIVPVFNSKQDAGAIKMYKKYFKNREIHPVYSKELLIGGGNFHCALHEIPEV